jgi:HEAT repeat protein
MVNWLSGLLARVTIAPHKRLIHFLGLGATVTATTVVSYTVGASLFLNQVGSAGLPLFNLLLGLTSIPVSLGVSAIIDRYPRLRLYRILFAVGILITSLLWRLLSLTHDYYTLYISLSLLDLLSGILFWTLVADYFTSLEFKQHTPLLTMAMTGGGILSGWLVHFVSRHLETTQLLLLLPILYLLAIAQLTILDRCERPLTPEKTRPDSLFTSLQSFPQLLRRYPIILLLAISTLISTLVWQLSEFQFSQIYTHVVTDQQALTSFLGLLSAGFSILELGVAGLVTRPLLQNWGVNHLNLIYPITTLVSFLGLLANGWLPAAIVMNINYDALYSSIAQPVQNLNYNAVPYRFVGRVRIIIDGLVYPISQVLVGVILLQLRSSLTFRQLTWIGVAFSFVAIGVGYVTGKSYLHALLARLQSGSVNLEEVQLARLPTDYAQEVRQLLVSDEPSTQLLGLELAARLDDSAQFLDQLQRLLLQADGTVRLAVVMLLSSRRHPEFDRFLRTQLVSDYAEVREAVLEALIRSQQPISDIQLGYFLEDPSPSVRALACVAVRQADHVGKAIWLAYNQVWQLTGTSAMNDAARRAVIRAIGRRTLSDRLRGRLMPMLEQLLPNAGASVKQEGLTALAALARPDDRHLINLACTDLHHSHPAVRAAAVNLLAKIKEPMLLPKLGMALEDSDVSVRRQAIVAIAPYRDLAIPTVQAYLSHPRPDVVEAAIATLGKIQTKQAEELLHQHLQPYYRQIARSLVWQRQLPNHLPMWSILAIALQDYHRQVIHRVFYVLSCLGYESTINTVRRLLDGNDVRRRANAIETLASLPHRRFVQAILPLLQEPLLPLQPNPAVFSQNRVPTTQHDPSLKLIHEILDTCTGELRSSAIPEHTDICWQSRWIRIGALVVILASGDSPPTYLETDPDPWVRMTLRQLTLLPTQHPPVQELFVNRILFLKTVSLLQSLSLDDLLMVDRVLQHQDFLAGEIIFHEGSQEETLHILYRGQVRIVKQRSQQQLALLETGEYFGDMALLNDAPRSATAVAATDCTLLTLDRSNFESLIAQRPELLLHMCRVLSMRLRDADQRLDALKASHSLDAKRAVQP